MDLKFNHNRLALLREFCGISQRQAGELVGQNQAEISAYELGRRRMSPARLKEFARIYGVSEEWLCRPGVSDAIPIEASSSPAAKLPRTRPPTTRNAVPANKTEPPREPILDAPSAEFPEFADVLAELKGALSATAMAADERVRAGEEALQRSEKEFSEAVALCSLALSDYRTALRSSASEKIRARISGREFSSTSVEDHATALLTMAHGVQEVALRLHSHLTEIVRAPEEKFIRVNPRRSLPPPPERLPPPPAPEVTAAKEAEVTAIIPAPPATEPEKVPEENEAPLGEASEDPPAPKTEDNARGRARRILLVGGKTAPHPEVVSAARRRFNIELDWVEDSVDAPRRLEGALKGLGSSGRVSGVILIAACISHKNSEKLKGALNERPLEYAKNGGTTSLNDAIGRMFTKLTRAQLPASTAA